MGVFYGVDGNLSVRDNTNSREILARLEELVGGGLEVNVEDGDGIFTVEISGGEHMSYGGTEEIDKVLAEFGPHVTEAVRLFTDCDGERLEMWVGEDKDVEPAKRAALLQAARDAVRRLTEEEAEALIAEMQGGDFWRN